MKKAVFLCGFMGCGKTTVGKVAAKMLGMELVDLDEYIEQQEKTSIPVIFSTKGEEYFRSCERKAIGQFEGKSAVVDDPHRPIAYNSTKQQLKERFEQRRKLYQQHSDITLDGSLSPVQIASEIKKAAMGCMN